MWKCQIFFFKKREGEIVCCFFILVTQLVHVHSLIVNNLSLQVIAPIFDPKWTYGGNCIATSFKDNFPTYKSSNQSWVSGQYRGSWNHPETYHDVDECTKVSQCTVNINVLFYFKHKSILMTLELSPPSKYSH